jgi:hypothetical protein
MRWIMLVAVLVVPTAQVLASEIDRGSPSLFGYGPAFEQLLSGTPGLAWEGLNQGRFLSNEVDSVFLRSSDAIGDALPVDVQSALVQPGSEHRQMHETHPDPAQDQTADSRNTTVIHPMAGKSAIDNPGHVIASKGDLASTTVAKNNLNLSFADAIPLGNDQEGEPLFNVISFKGPGFAAVILLALWSLVAAGVLLVHYRQKAEQRRDLAMLRRLSSMRVGSVMMPVPPGERALQARLDALADHEPSTRYRTANSNTNQPIVHAA